jgi:hypothetical protein
MITGRRSTDWLSGPLQVRSGDDERCGQDRRASDRRAPRRRLDPLFAATLVSQLAPQATRTAAAYVPPVRTVRHGLLVNFQA